MWTRHRKPACVAGLWSPGAVLLLALAACADPQMPTESATVISAPARIIQMYDCVGSVAQGVSCRPSVSRTHGPSSALIGGGAVQITSVGGSYDSSAEVLTANVTVKNLMQEAIGTPDGTMTAPNGIRVFFSTGPTVQTGAGSVSVANPDGYAFFTAADQPYFTYSEILDKNEVSAAKTWQFDVPTTVGTFTFTLLVQTEVQYLLVINEVLTNPGGAISDVNGEWFEIYNAGTLGVDLQGLVIADSAASGRRPYHVIASSINVPSGGYAVLGAVVDTVINGGADVDYAYGSALALANSVDALKISRVYGTDTLTLDRVSYLNAAVSAQNGISRELKNPALDNANMDGSNWADASATAVYGAAGRGTPRAQNSAYVP